MSSQIDELKAELARLTRHAQTLIAPLDEAQLSATPPGGGWSVGQCFAHLNTVGRSYTDKLERAVNDARRRGLSGTEPYRIGIFGRFFVRSQEPPVRRKIGAPIAFMPNDLTPIEAFTRYLEMHANLADVMTRAEGLPLNQIKITSTRLRLNVFETFHATLAHERRHLWQVESILTSFQSTAQSR
jgi:DinB superfamily